MNLISAKEYLHLYDSEKHVSGEGTCFDGKGNFYCCVMGDGFPKILKIDPWKNVSVFCELSTDDIPCGLIEHQGRFCCCGLNGILYVIDEEGTILFKKESLYQNRKLKMNDLIFIEDDIYLTDFRGDFLHPDGGIFILKAEDNYEKPHLFLDGLCSPNGIAFHENDLFISETTRADLLRISLDEDLQIKEEFGIMPIYSNVGKGGALDSIKMSKNGFLYQAVMAAGKVIILDREGLELAEIHVEGKNRMTPNLALNEKEGYGLILAFGTDGLDLMKFEIEGGFKMKAAIFDLDGVILSTDDLHYEAWKKIADQEGIYFDREINNRLRGVSRMASLEIILENADREYSLEEKEKLAEEKNGYYRELLKTITPDAVFDGVRETIDALKKKGIRVAIGSSSKNTKFILKQIGMLEEFDAISDGNNITHSKPDPEVFLKAAEMLDIEPEDCVVIEDAIAGIEAAKAGKMRAAAVGDARKSKLADDCLDDIRDLLNLFD